MNIFVDLWLPIILGAIVLGCAAEFIYRAKKETDEKKEKEALKAQLVRFEAQLKNRHEI